MIRATKASASLLGLTGAVVVGSSLLVSSPASACTCATPRDERDYVQASSIAFEGEVLSSERKAEGSVHRLGVLRYWKGALGGEVDVATESGACQESSCAIRLLQGERYLVFASLGRYCAPIADLCSGTRLAVDATNTFVQLGPAAAPGSGPGPYDDGPPSPADSCTAFHDASTCPNGTDSGASGGTGGIPTLADAAPPVSGGTCGSSGTCGAGSTAGSPTSDDVRTRSSQPESVGCACRAAGMTRNTDPNFPSSAAVGWIGALAVGRLFLNRRRRLARPGQPTGSVR